MDGIKSSLSGDRLEAHSCEALRFRTLPFFFSNILNLFFLLRSEENRYYSTLAPHIKVFFLGYKVIEVLLIITLKAICHSRQIYGLIFFFEKK